MYGGPWCDRGILGGGRCNEDPWGNWGGLVQRGGRGQWGSLRQWGRGLVQKGPSCKRCSWGGTGDVDPQRPREAILGCKGELCCSPHCGKNGAGFTRGRFPPAALPPHGPPWHGGDADAAQGQAKSCLTLRTPRVAQKGTTGGGGERDSQDGNLQRDPGKTKEGPCGPCPSNRIWPERE